MNKKKDFTNVIYNDVIRATTCILIQVMSQNM